MEDILYSIRDHAIGLNCGMWDYNASIIAKFGWDRRFLVYDRKNINMTKPYMQTYMKMLIEICHRRRALATGGMAAQILPPGKGTCPKSKEIIEMVMKSKSLELDAGVDGYLCYDMRIVPHMGELFKQKSSAENQMDKLPDVADIKPETLLEIPHGSISMEAIR